MRRLTFVLLSLIIVISLESLNIAFTGISETEAVRQGGDLRPQIATIVLWTLLTALSFIPDAVRTPLRTKELYWPAVLIGWIILSSLWSDDPAGGLPKAAVLLGTTLAAWRLTSLISVKDMFNCLFYVLSAMLFASLILIFLVPSVGVVQVEWQHEGNWRGIFGSKQGMGIASAVFVGIALLRVVERRALFDCAMCVAGFACLIGSASRGAGVIAVVAVVCLLVSRKYPKLVLLVAGVLSIDITLAIADIAYFSITGNPSVQAFGYDVNFTERTFIWQYALDLWLNRPLLGFGLNGFWNDSNIYYSYQRMHGWVLDNSHSGYVTMIVETGAVGFALFMVMSMKLISRLSFLMAHAKHNRISLEMTAVFLVMYFTINLTETYFLRSTNFLAVLFVFLTIKIIAVPDTVSARSIVRTRYVTPQRYKTVPAT